jgi:hypothetical protein
MKRSQAFPSRFLAQSDVATPIVATIANVTQEDLTGDRGLETKAVMTFTDPRLKALVVNNINWTTCEAAFGEDSDAWHGQQIEIYADPSIMFGRDRVGGIRVRIPSAPRPAARPQFFPPRTAAPKPAAPTARQFTIDDKHKFIVEGYKTAKTEQKVYELAEAAGRQDFAPHHTEEQSDAYHEALQRLGIEVNVPADNDIPF